MKLEVERNIFDKKYCPLFKLKLQPAVLYNLQHFDFQNSKVLTCHDQIGEEIVEDSELTVHDINK